MVRKKKKKSIIRRLFKFFAVSAFLIFIGAVSAGIVAFSYFTKDLPDPQQILSKRAAESTKIYDRTGKVLLYDIYGDEKRTIVSLDNISPHLKNAVIAVEDENFYQHKGFDFKAFFRALIVDIKEKKIVQGGSTITQQLIKNSMLTPEKTVVRKIKEAALSLKLEKKYSKDKILEMYLNQIPFISNAYGAEAASQTLFGKKAENVTLNEAVVLAALPKSPTYYSPYGNHKDKLIQRKNRILDKMFSLNFISKKELETAKEEELKFLTQKINIKAPHFVMFVREYLNSKYGEEYIQKAGLKVYTTLNYEFQKSAEETIKKWGKINEKKYGAQNSALVAIDPKTGRILAMVGSRDYFDIKNDGNVNVTLSLRQPGSAFKPIAYATAFNKGYLPETVVFDLKTEFNPNCPPSADQDRDQYGLGCYNPNNYDGKFRGPVSLRQSLAQSLNVPSVKVLYLAGIEDTIKLAEKMGISSLKNRNFGLALVLGGAEVKLIELTSAYGIFANDGILNPYNPILKITDSRGKIIEEHKPQPKRVLKNQTARLINDILSDNKTRTPVFGAKSNLYIESYQTAAKTGTTQEYKDAWLVGYTPSVVVGVWSGNNIPKPMKQGAAGTNVSGPIWNEFMKEILKKYPKEKFIKSQQTSPLKEILSGKFEEETKIKLDKISGKLATNLTPLEYMEEKIYKKAHTILKYVTGNDPTGNVPVNPEDNPQFKNWEDPVLVWAADPKRIEEGRNYREEPPIETDNIHTEENKPKIKIIQPENNTVINTNILIIKAEIFGNYPIKQVDFFLNNKLISSDLYLPYSTSYLISSFERNKKHTVKVRVFDVKGNRNENVIDVFIK